MIVPLWDKVFRFTAICCQVVSIFPEPIISCPRLLTYLPSMPHLQLGLFTFLSCFHFVHAAFTIPTDSDKNVVEQNAKGQWCYYPAVAQTQAVSCTGDFIAVSLVHLNTTISIGYYGPDNARYGGAEWSVPQVNPGRVTLCVSGQAGDGTYQSACMFVTSDNSLPLYGSACLIEIAQKNVTDGCYMPGELAFTMTSTASSGSTAHPDSNSDSATSTSMLSGELTGISYLILHLWFQEA